MLLATGEHRFDLTHRALVVAVVTVAEVGGVATCISEGADVVHLVGAPGPSAVAAVVARGIPVWVDGDPAGAALPDLLAAGASGFRAADGTPGGAVLDAVAGTGAVLLVASTAAAAAVAPGDPVVVDLGVESAVTPAAARTALAATARLAAPGAIVGVSVRGPELVVPGDPAGPDDVRRVAQAAMALAISQGARVVRTTDVGGARRVRDVLAAVLAAGAVDRPGTGAVALR